MVRRKKPVRFDRVFATVVAVAFAVLPGCGGQSVVQTGDAEAGDGGSSGEGGSSANGGLPAKGGSSSAGTSGTAAGGVSGTGAVPTGGASGTGGSGSCIYNARRYELGTSFAAVDGCNTCTCTEGGVVACTLIDCQVHCDWNGTFYAHGSSFPEPDGCGTCRCAYREITCESQPCPPGSCDALSAAYSEFMMTSAKQCDPSIDIPQCTNLVNSSLPCGCQTWVNDADPLEVWRNEWEARGCLLPPCVPCPAPARAANCSLDGICVDVP